MLTLSFTFSAGRYHATPLGRHVNEADVAWPPDLWRLARAFIAIWHRKLDPAAYSRERLAGLLATLASEPPHYHLPEAIHFHTRHYMPVEGRRGRPPLIFDAFAYMGRDAELIVHWPTLDLTGKQTELLNALLLVLGYVGRAESWVEAHRIGDWRDECNCFPGEEAVNPHTGEFGDVVPLWLPRTPEGYAQERTRLLALALNQERTTLERRRTEAIAQGRRRATGPATAEVPREVASTLPEDWLAALSLDTGELQQACWSAPPAAKRLYYIRPRDTLRFVAARSMPLRRVHKALPVTTVRYALYTKPLPRITEAVRVGELLRLGVMGRAKRLFDGAIPPILSGHDLPDGNRHGHAFFLPEDSDGDGRIDHLVLHAPAGLDDRAVAVLAGLNNIKMGERVDWRLMLEGMGSVEHFQQAETKLIKCARVWKSVTPYFHPWYRKKNFGLAEQIRRECRLRHLLEPERVEALAHRKPRSLEFRRFRSKRGLEQPDRLGCFLRLTFAEPFHGPLALGFSCHFGLGLFAPAPDA